MLVISFGTFALELQDWSIVANKGRMMLTASEHISASRKGEILILSEKVDMSSPKSVIANYYWLLKNQKLSNIAKLYTSKDGSRQKFEQELNSKRLKLNKFSSLESVRITGVQKWDEFSVYELQLFAKNKRKMNWKEKVVCEKQCYLVFDLLENTPASELLDISKMTYLESTRVFGDLTNKIKFKNKPIKITVHHPDSGVYKGKKLPLIYRLDLVRYAKSDVIDRNVNCEQYKTMDTAAFCQFLRETEQVDSADESELAKYLAQVTGKPGASVVTVNENKTGSMKSVLYSAKAFVILVNKWQSIKLIGYIESDLTRFVLFEPTTKNKKTLPIQAVSFAIGAESKSNKLIYGSNWEDGYLFFYNNIFMNGLNRSL